MSFGLQNLVEVASLVMECEVLSESSKESGCPHPNEGSMVFAARSSGSGEMLRR